MARKIVSVDEATYALPDPVLAKVKTDLAETISTPFGYDVILLAGQSNMSGRGTAYSAATDPAHPMIFQYKGKIPNKGTIIAAAEPLDMVDTPSGIGPGFQFARWYVAQGLNRGRKVLLVPAAQGGTPLTRVTGPTWKPSSAGLYTNAITQANGAIAAEAGSRIVAVLWLQGETDGDLAATGAAYQTEFDALIAGFRSSITGASGVPFIIGQMVPEYLSTGTRTEINAVHAGAPARLARVAFAPSPLASNLGDGNHFNAAGARLIGQGMFAAFERVAVGLPAVPLSAAVAAATGPTTLGVTALPAMAYSLRQIVSSYTGPLVRVRRSSDDTELDIGLTANLLTGYSKILNSPALLSFAGAGDAFVTKWYDQSGNVRHLAQTDVTKQPKIVSAGAMILVNTRPIVEFDGVDDHLFHGFAPLYAAGKTTVAGVMSCSTIGPSRWWCESAAAQGSGLQYALMQPDTADPEPLAVLTGIVMPRQLIQPLFDLTLRQHTGTDTGTAISQWVDGKLTLESGVYTRSGAAKDTFALGGVVRAGNLSPAKNLKVAEAVYWPSVLPAGERRDADASQKSFYITP